MLSEEIGQDYSGGAARLWFRFAFGLDGAAPTFLPNSRPYFRLDFNATLFFLNLFILMTRIVARSTGRVVAPRV